MSVLVIGASGATGSLVVDLLLRKGEAVVVILRPAAELPKAWENQKGLKIIRNLAAEMSSADWLPLLNECNTVVSCLGHTLSWKGIYGKPRRLVKDTVQHICEAAMSPERTIPLRFILMNTAGNRNHDLKEKVSIAHRMLLALIRAVLPPHADNEEAANYLRLKIGQNHPGIEWVAVRPVSLVNEEKISPYEVYPSPVRSALFDAGKVSRLNVADLMRRLATDDALWQFWKGQMPVIYNAQDSSKEGQA